MSLLVPAQPNFSDICSYCQVFLGGWLPIADEDREAGDSTFAAVPESDDDEDRRRGGGGGGAPRERWAPGGGRSRGAGLPRIGRAYVRQHANIHRVAVKRWVKRHGCR